MSNITKLEFAALSLNGNNYLSWVLDTKLHLDSMGLGNTINEDGIASKQNRAKAMIFIRHHLDPTLKDEYLTIEDPADLWKNLKERFDHQKTVILPMARNEWLNLRFQDFKTVSEYCSAIFRITSKLKLCGEPVTDGQIMEKTFSTFHANDLLLQQQYRQKGFTKYSELIACLLVAEQNNQLLMKNHESRPTGSAPFPEANVASKNNFSNRQNHGRGRGRGNSHYGGRGRKHNYHQKWINDHTRHQKLANNGKGKERYNPTNFSKNSESSCYRCGMKGHWSRTCRTPQHLVKLYQASMKESKKDVEANLAYPEDRATTNNDAEKSNNDGVFNELFNVAHMDAEDFFD